MTGCERGDGFAEHATFFDGEMKVLLLLALAAEAAQLVKEHPAVAAKRDALHAKLATMSPETTGRRLQSVAFEAPFIDIPVTAFEEMEQVIAGTTVVVRFFVNDMISFQAPLVIPADTTIYIVGNETIFDASGVSQHFVVYGNLWLENVALINGFGSNGGSVLVNDGGVLTARNASFANNTASELGPSAAPTPSPLPAQQLPGLPPPEARPYPGVGDGGAIAAFNSSVVDIQTCTFMTNLATRMGGAIVAEDLSILAVSDSLFWMNEARVLEIDNLPFGGGAIASVDNSVVDIVNSAFRKNKALLAGGAIMSTANERLTIKDSLFDGNSLDPFTCFPEFNPETGTGQLCFHYGGAVVSWATGIVETTNNFFTNHRWMEPRFNLQVGGAVAIAASNYTSNWDLFTNNGMANFTGGTILVESGWILIEGGGLYVEGAFNRFVDAQIWNASFQNNTAEMGGAIGTWTDCGSTGVPLVTTIRDSEFLRNEAIGYGGGFHSWGQQSGADVANTSFYSNRAGYGGAVSMYCPVFTDHVYEDVVMESNSAHQAGAVMVLSAGADTTFTNVQASMNAADDIEGHFVQGPTPDGGAFEFIAGDLTDDGSPRSLNKTVMFSFFSSDIVNNTALVDGGGIQGNRFRPNQCRNQIYISILRDLILYFLTVVSCVRS